VFCTRFIYPIAYHRNFAIFFSNSFFLFQKNPLLLFLGLLFSQNGKIFATIKNAGLLTKKFHLDLGEVLIKQEYALTL